MEQLNGIALNFRKFGKFYQLVYLVKGADKVISSITTELNIYLTT